MTMRELSHDQIDQVSGGNILLYPLIIVLVPEIIRQIQAEAAAAG
jgi:hypothetical protein